MTGVRVAVAIGRGNARGTVIASFLPAIERRRVVSGVSFRRRSAIGAPGVVRATRRSEGRPRRSAGESPEAILNQTLLPPTEGLTIFTHLTPFGVHDVVGVGDGVLAMSDGMPGPPTLEAGIAPIMKGFAAVVGVYERGPKRSVIDVEVRSGNGKNAVTNVGASRPSIKLLAERIVLIRVDGDDGTIGRTGSTLRLEGGGGKVTIVCGGVAVKPLSQYPWRAAWCSQLMTGRRSLSFRWCKRGRDGPTLFQRRRRGALARCPRNKTTNTAGNADR